MLKYHMVISSTQCTKCKVNIHLEGAVRHTFTKQSISISTQLLSLSCISRHVIQQAKISNLTNHRSETDHDLNSRLRVHHMFCLTKAKNTRAQDNTDTSWSELVYRRACQLDGWRYDTSGSPVSWLVWMRIFPSRMSLQTAIKACSMVSPARRMDTPVIYQTNKQERTQV